MNVNCIICSDLFQPSSEIYTTPCGHVFHYVCLIQWIERSRTCPQCRNKTTEKSIHRIYFNLANTEGINDDAATLQNKLDNLQFQVTLKEKDIKNVRDKYHDIKLQNKGLREEVRDIEGKCRSYDSTIHGLRDQISYLRQKAKETEKLSEELFRLREKLKDMESIEMVISGSREDVNNMLRHNNDPHSLTLLVSTLKKELMDADRRRKKVEAHLTRSQNEIINCKRELSLHRTQHAKLRQFFEDHRSCGNEKDYLKKKIENLESKISGACNSLTPDPNLQRIISESPAPLPIKERLNLGSDVTFSVMESPSLDVKVRTIMDSTSPYLPVKLSSVGFPAFTNKSSFASSSGDNKFSIFKQQTKTEHVKVPKPQGSYDGMGGHSKDDVFPTPNRTVAGMKRQKSTSSISSTKFRKLGPNKKLSEFLSSTNKDL